MIRQPYLHQSAISRIKPNASFSAAPSCMLMSPLQASALKSAYSFVSQENDSDADDLEELSFESSRPLMMKRKVRLDYVSDYEWDEDNDSLAEYEDEDQDAGSVDSEVTLHVSNKAYAHYSHTKLNTPASSATSSTVCSDDCSVSSVASFDSEVAVSKHHQPTPIYHHHHHRQSTPAAAQSPPTARKETRHSVSTMSNGTKKPFVRPDLMPSPLNTQSMPSPSCKSPIGRRRLFRTSSSRSAASVKTI